MNKKIVIVGSTGKLGSKLLTYSFKNSIPINTITCYKNLSKITKQKAKYSIKKKFVLSDYKDQSKFFKFLETKISIIYFLDYGSNSLKYLNHFLKFNSNSIIAIANKEMIIAGGHLLQKKIINSNNKFIPLDSEHFSLLNSNIKNNIQKIYITASGGPFYFSKNINLSKVSVKKVLSHPKWNMGKNNLIDSSNFINKVLEIYELSYIYNIPLNKIDFLVTKEAYIHSLIHYDDNTLSINCFNNDMLITLLKPLSFFFKIKPLRISQKYLINNNLKLSLPNDKRFEIFKYYNQLKKLSHKDQISLMIINNSAHNLYLSNKLEYNKIINYIMNNLKKENNIIKLNSISSILKHISNTNKFYKTNV